MVTCTDRLDEMLLFDTPDLRARQRLVHLYFRVYITEAAERQRKGAVFRRGPPSIQVGEGISEQYLDVLAERMDGWSGRAISKFFIAAQVSVV